MITTFIQNTYLVIFIPSEVINSQQNIALVLIRSNTLPEECQHHVVKFSGIGGYPKHRVMPSQQSGMASNYQCYAYSSFFQRIAPYDNDEILMATTP